jgi:hypothetical protein
LSFDVMTRMWDLGILLGENGQLFGCRERRGDMKSSICFHPVGASSRRDREKEYDRALAKSLKKNEVANVVRVGKPLLPGTLRSPATGGVPAILQEGRLRVEADQDEGTTTYYDRSATLASNF